MGVPALIRPTTLGVTFGLVPLFVLTACVLRTASIAKETRALGPFVLQRSERAPFVDREE